MKFLVDNNLPPALARALHALSEPDDHSVVHLREKFAPNTKDSDWIEALARESGWSVITHDKLNKGLEREALRRAGLLVFFLDKGRSNHRFWGIAHNLVRWWPRIIEQSEGIKGGAAFKVPYNFTGKGQFEQVKL
ncbi:DUF5615 family PIN-like protein [Trinickia sp.]|uniref:DUF5615 family PIN-like protein n=1 Tax=Trinickia sp. TaxID=2571163 RepID=UPI003F7F85B5